MVGGTFDNGLPELPLELTLPTALEDKTTHFRRVSGSRLEEEWQNEVVTFSVIEGSPTSALVALKPQRVTEMLMEDNIETLGVQDTQTKAGTLVIFTQ